MEITEFDRLLQTETERIEWKESLKQTQELFHAVCALANDLGDSRQPGYLLLGVSKDGTVPGLNVAGNALDEEQRALADRFRSTKLLPTPSFHIDIVEYLGRTVLVVAVEPYSVPPVVSVDGVVWVRSDSTTVKAREADLQRLRERRPAIYQPFDLRVVRNASLSDLETLELERLHAATKENDDDQDAFSDLEHWLTSRQLGMYVEGTWRPNAGAILLYGKAPQCFLPGAVVDFVRYAGRDVDATPALRKIATGTVTNQLDTLWTILQSTNPQHPIEQGPVQLSFANEYPPEVLKELVRNMVQHRLYEATNAPGRIEWYDDRIELSNPGGPFGQASQGSFGEHADYRNPILTEGLVALGYVQQLGRGVRRCRLLLQQAGFPELEVQTNGFTRVIVRRPR